MIRRSRLAAAATCAVAVVMFTACAQPGSPGPAPTATPEPEPLPTGEDIAAWVADASWSYAPQGLLAPHDVPLVAGEGTDDAGRQYTLGDGVTGDANGDGVPDIAMPIQQVDGNGYEELWYVWLGLPGPASDGALAEQMRYPIARASRCGTAVHAVSRVDDGFAVEETLRLAQDTGDCATDGSGRQTRTVTVHEIDGEAFPVMTDPIDAWGGVCPVPTTEWLHGIEVTGTAARVAPPASAPVAIPATEAWATFPLPVDATLVTRADAAFVGMQPAAYWSHTGEQTREIPVRSQCAFATPEGDLPGTPEGPGPGEAPGGELGAPDPASPPPGDDGCPPPRSLLECYG